MNEDVRRAISDSAYDFQRLIWPPMSKLVGGGRLLPVETTNTEESAAMLDTLAGIDSWHVLDGVGMRGVASRIQWVDRSWSTFTIRYALRSGNRTEWQKRVEAIENGTLLKPEWTVQGYATKPKRGGILLDAALISTTTLYRYAVKRIGYCEGCVGKKHGREGVWLQKHPDDGNVFVCVSWAALGITSFAGMGLVVDGDLERQLELVAARP